MKIIMVEEVDDRYSIVVAVAKTLADLRQKLKLRCTLYLVTERKNSWELAASVGFSGVIKKSCLKKELFDTIINEEPNIDGKTNS